MGFTDSEPKPTFRRWFVVVGFPEVEAIDTVESLSGSDDSLPGLEASGSEFNFGVVSGVTWCSPSLLPF
jgi:hypothetical protein